MCHLSQKQHFLLENMCFEIKYTTFAYTPGWYQCVILGYHNISQNHTCNAVLGVENGQKSSNSIKKHVFSIKMCVLRQKISNTTVNPVNILGD